MLVWKMGAQLLVPFEKRTARIEMVKVLHLTKPLSVCIVALLFVAAIIESTLTYWLVHM
ncbi:hypothetical protein D3C85_1852240 [compost metagenome]